MPEQIRLFEPLQDREQIRSGGGARKRRLLAHTYEDIISMDNLLAAWKEFRRSKRTKLDVLEFQSGLIYQTTALHEELRTKRYTHGGYQHFKIADPKPRDIHKASVRDRLLHHALYRNLYPYFDRKFIPDSYSCRVGKGTHRAIAQFRAYAQKCARNHTRTCWVLKCDVRKFFASIDHPILFRILEKHMDSPDIRWLLRQVVSSFPPEQGRTLLRRGLPLGNLTSQLLVNVYMNEFDQFVKHQLKTKHYIRYADDFVLLSHSRSELEEQLGYIEVFLCGQLKLQLHPDKVFIKTLSSGVDFLGWVHFPDHRTLRTATKRRMLRRVVGHEPDSPTVRSYKGMLGHGNTQKLLLRLPQ